MRPPVSQLSTAKQDKRRAQRRKDQRKHRERQRAVEEILNFTPESFDTTPVAVAPQAVDVSPIVQLQQDTSITVSESSVSFNVQEPRASSSPVRVASNNLKWRQEKSRFRYKMNTMKREMDAAKRETEKLRKRIERLKKNRSKKQNEKPTTKANRSMAAKKKEKVADFLCRDENSRLLPGRKDTVTKNKNKQQRRVLVKPLTELQSSYNSEMEKSHRLSYRQFVRYCPFFVTQPKESDRNTCACLDHENVTLLSEKLWQKGLTKSTSVSQLLSEIVCSLDNKACMYRLCAKCCYEEVKTSRQKTW